MGVEVPSNPINRKEQYLAKIAGQAVEIPAEPLTREEAYLDEIAKNGSGGGGTTNYNSLSNKPQIAGTELQGNKSLADLGIASASDLAAKQNALTAGDYIDITNDEISVNREIPSVIAEYEIKTEPMVEGQAFISVTKTVNGEIVLTQKYGSSTAGINQGINFDENIYVDYSKTASWSWTYKLRNASVDHAANYTQSWNYGSTVDYTEEFIVTDHSGDKLVIKSEMDTALSGKQDTLTFDDTPTDNSNNPVKSNGIYDSEKDIYAVMGEMGAKNLIPYPYYESDHTESGITWTVNSDGSITANGTATANSTFVFRHRAEQTKFIEKNTSYILSGCPIGGSNSKYSLSFFVKNEDDSNITSGVDYGNGVTIDMPNQDYYGIHAIARVFSGQTVSNLTFKPMLRLASDTDNTFQPYAKTNKQLTDDVALLDSKKADTDMVAADFNAGSSYTAGNYCVQEGKLYKFKNNHSGAWSSADVDEVKIAGELSSLKSGLTNVSGKVPIHGGFNIHCVQGINVFERNTLTLVAGSLPSSSFGECIMSITNHGSNSSTVNTVETDGTDTIIINAQIEQNIYVTWLDMSNIPVQQ